MQKLLLYAVVVVLLLSTSSASSLHSAESLVLDQSVRSGLVFTPTSPSYQVDTARINVYLFAQNDTRQEVLTTEHGPGYVRQETNRLVYEWSQPEKTRLPLQVEQRVETSAKIVPITEKSSFPIQEIPPEIAKYVSFTDKIDRSPAIASLAQELAAGEDDLFKLQVKIAEWIVQNIEYNLSTITVEANQPASLVIEQGFGVCDEITNLFLAINRELGIPARFVSGIAYSESILFNTKWGNHGWAEVYFPEVGWVPFDVTYQQLGWIDATHIALAKEIDGATPALTTHAMGFGYEFMTEPLSFETTLSYEGEQLPSRTISTLSFFADEVSSGSANAVIVELTNTNNYYVSEKITLAPTQGLEVMGEVTRHIALAPGETKTVLWHVRVQDTLEQGFRYTFPVSILDSTGRQQRSEFFVQENFEYIAFERLPQSSKEHKQELFVQCFGPGEIEEHTPAEIRCQLTPDTRRTTEICYYSNCQEVSVARDAVFSVPTEEMGVYSSRLLAGTQEVFVSYRVTDPAKANISSTSMSYQNYEEPVQLSFIVEKESYSVPENITISIQHELFEKVYELDSLQRDQPVALAIPHELFALGVNEMYISVNHEKGQLANKTVELTVKPESLRQFVFGSVNYISRELTRQGVENNQLRSVRTIAIAGSITYFCLQLIVRGMRKVLRKKISKP